MLIFPIWFLSYLIHYFNLLPEPSFTVPDSRAFEYFLRLKLITKKTLPQKRFAIGSEQLEWNRELVKYLSEEISPKALVWDGEALLISGLSLQGWQKHLAVKVSAGWITEQFIKLTRLWWGHRGIDAERHEVKQGTGGISVMKSKISIPEFCSDTAALAVPRLTQSPTAGSLSHVLIPACGWGTHRSPGGWPWSSHGQAPSQAHFQPLWAQQ